MRFIGVCLAPANAHQLYQPLLPWLYLSATLAAFLCSCHGSSAFLPYKPGQSASPRPAAVRHFILLGRNFQQWRCSTEQGEYPARCHRTVCLRVLGVGDVQAGLPSLLGQAACAQKCAVGCLFPAPDTLLSDLLITTYFKTS